MKLLNWMQNKFNGKQGSNKTNISSPYKSESKEEFSDWPQAFLSIGTFGNKDLKEETKVQNHNNIQTQELTSEEVKQLQKELNALVSSCDLDSLATLEAAAKGEGNGDQEETDQQKHFATIAPNSSSNTIIGKNSVSFLLKKMFICGAGLGPTPSLRDPILSPPQTRMEKILKAILHKKIYPQNSAPPTSKKKYLATRHIPSTNKLDDSDDDDYDPHQRNEGSKWVKTDTEYIVLEI